MTRGHPPYEGLCRFILDRALEDELHQLRRSHPDRDVLDRCALAEQMVLRTRGTHSWRHRTWRTAMVGLAEVHDRHAAFRPEWRRLTGLRADLAS